MNKLAILIVTNSNQYYFLNLRRIKPIIPIIMMAIVDGADTIQASVVRTINQPTALWPLARSCVRFPTAFRLG